MSGRENEVKEERASRERYPSHLSYGQNFSTRQGVSRPVSIIDGKNSIESPPPTIVHPPFNPSKEPSPSTPRGRGKKQHVSIVTKPARYRYNDDVYYIECSSFCF